jgi:arsenate reductase
MAEAFWKKYANGKWEAVSAGTHPKDHVYPLAVRAMAEKGIDIGANKPKDVKAYTDQRFDLVITVCSDAERECPHFANAAKHLHWPFDGPPKATGTDEQRMRVCRRVRDEIESKVKQFMNSQSGY